MSAINKSIEELTPEQRELLELLLEEEGVDPAALPLPPRGRQSAMFPLSFAQQRLWFLHQLDPDNIAYNVAFAVRLKGALDVRALEESLSEVLRRHEALRTTFAVVDGDPRQVIGEPSPMRLPVEDVSALPAEEREKEILRLAEEAARTGFDLARGPMLRVKLARSGADEHVAILTMHHIISDVWSMGVFLRELSTLYNAFVAGRPSPLAEPPIQYADFAVWQRQRLQGEALNEHLDYWRGQLADVAPMLSLPTDRPRPPANTYRGANAPLRLRRELREGLKELSRQEGVTLFMTLLAAYKTLLHRYSGQRDIVVGAPIANRNRPEIENLIGFFANTLALRTDLGGAPSFRELLARVKEVTVGAYAHQDLPFEALVEAIQPERDMSRNPLCQVWFALEIAPGEDYRFTGLTMSSLAVEDTTAKFDLTLLLNEAEGELSGQFNYNADLFDASTISRLAAHFERLIGEIVANPARKITQLEMLSEAEVRTIVEEWNETERAWGEWRPVHEIIAEQARQRGEAIALKSRHGELSYEELDRRANQLSHYLRGLGVRPGVVVGLCLERSLELVIGLLGILKAGGAYLPLAPEYPAERLARMLNDARAPALLTRKGLLERLPDSGARMVCLDSEWERIASQSAQAAPSQVGPDDLIYVIYTSGSTGQPKGSAIYHRGVTNLLRWFITDFEIAADDCVLVTSSPNFDLTQKSFFAPLMVGATMGLSHHQYYDPAVIRQEIAEQGATLLNCTPSAFYPLVEGIESHEMEGLRSLRLVFLGGEPIAMTRLRRWLGSACCRARIINTYGPTESTDVCAYYRIEEPERFLSEAMPIGGPIYNTQLFILGSNLELLPVGVIGELCVQGEGVGFGYLNNVELTAEKFIPNPFSRRTGERFYKTGDLARFLPDGSIEFVARADRQIKLRGFRIELAEIEVALARHPAVREVVVVDFKTPAGETQLAAYIAWKHDGEAANLGELRGYLRQILPEYMTPSVFISLESLPLTNNGKVDRRALPPPNQANLRGERTVAPPRDNLEIQLAQIWRDVLGIEGEIGITENFFELGGHSIMAVLLMSQISKWFGQKLPLSALFRGATIERLAESLRGQAAAEAPSPLVPIQPKGRKRPFFCVHTGSGEVLSYESWARYLGENQPFYGLQDHMAYREDEETLSLEEIAARYLSAVKTVQNEGPYQLGGWSFGGLVAFEMAQQLKAEGQEVSLLLLVDAPSPAFAQEVADSDDATLLTIIANQLTRSTMSYEEMKMLVEDLRQLSSEEQLGRVLRYFVETRNGADYDAEYALEFLRRQLRVFRSRENVSHRYKPRFYQGRITLFRPIEEPEEWHRLDQTKGWGELSIAPVDIRRVPGNHQTMGLEPNVRDLAEQLRECLEQAQTAAPGKVF